MSKEANKKLTAKQSAFVQYYLANGFNATQAAISAGYSKHTAKDIGCENLAKPNIAKIIAEAQAEKGKELQTKYGLSVEGQIKKLIAAEKFSIDCDNPSALIKAIEAQNKLADLNPTEKKEIEITGLDVKKVTFK